jgi:hypothetical protein
MPPPVKGNFAGASVTPPQIPQSAPAAPGVIDIRINTVAQLFNSFDPSPFQARDLDDDAEEFIVGSAREAPPKARLRIRVHLPADQCESEGARTLGHAIEQHFNYRIAVQKRELDELFLIGRRHLLVGLSIFAICTVLSQLIRNAFPGNGLMEGVEQGLIIIGWVANWRPFEILIYDWWPLRRRLDLYRRLAEAEIEVKAA